MANVVLVVAELPAMEALAAEHKAPEERALHQEMDTRALMALLIKVEIQKMKAAAVAAVTSAVAAVEITQVVAVDPVMLHS
jgi:hypothetical protein